MELIAKCSRFGDKVIRFISLILAILLLLYGGYSLWDNYQTYNNAFNSDEILKYKPKTDDPLSLSKLKEINEDVRAWVTIKDTHIDHPVVQGKGNLDYINKNVFKEFELSGSIFLDSQNKPDFSDTYNLLFGHHMDNGAMFGDISHFVEKEYFDKHQQGELITFDATYKIEIFACMATNSGNYLIYNTSNQGSREIRGLLDHIKTKSNQYKDIGVNENDKIIAFSTCSEATTNGRIVVFGKLIKV